MDGDTDGESYWQLIIQTWLAGKSLTNCVLMEHLSKQMEHIPAGNVWFPEDISIAYDFFDPWDPHPKLQFKLKLKKMPGIIWINMEEPTDVASLGARPIVMHRRLVFAQASAESKQHGARNWSGWLTNAVKAAPVWRLAGGTSWPF